MDTSAVITQVTPPADNDNPIHSTTEETSTATETLSNVNNKQAKKSNKNKKKRNHFLCSIFCCLGRNQRQSQRAIENGSTVDGISEKSLQQPQHQETAPGLSKKLLPPLQSEDFNKKCIVIDLDETLVHSSFKPINNADFIVPVEIDGIIHQVYVLKRPYVDEFLCKMGELYECVLFTASLAKYADPVADLLDKWDVFKSRLFRESCVFHRGNYVKDLSRLGREIHKILIVDNSPASYIFHPENAIPVASWFDDMNDRELLDLIPFLEKVSKVENVYTILQTSKTGSLTKEQNSWIKKNESNFLM